MFYTNLRIWESFWHHFSHSYHLRLENIDRVWNEQKTQNKIGNNSWLCHSSACVANNSKFGWQQEKRVFLFRFHFISFQDEKNNLFMFSCILLLLSVAIQYAKSNAETETSIDCQYDNFHYQFHEELDHPHFLVIDLSNR